MSIVVDVTKLAETLRDFGSGYLLTVSPEGRVKVITVDPVVDGATLRVSGPWWPFPRLMEFNRRDLKKWVAKKQTVVQGEDAPW